MSTRTRVQIASSLAIGSLCVALHFWLDYLVPGRRSDFDQIWFAARAMLSGSDPYTSIGPGRAFDQPWPFYYPLPTALLASPVAGLKLEWARSLVSGVCGGVFAYAVIRSGRAATFALVSAPFGIAIANGQLGPLIAAGALIPVWGAAASAKPNVGLVAMAGARTWAAILPSVVGTLALFTVAFAIQPNWFSSWVSATAGAPHFAPYVVRPFGAVALLALARWRRPDARALVAAAVIPGTPSIYDALIPLTLTLVYARPSNRLAALLAVLSMAALPAAQYMTPNGAPFDVRVMTAASVDMWLIMVPCVILVLRSPEIVSAEVVVAATPAVGSS